MNRVGMILADLHFGASDPKRLYEELEEQVLNKIDSLPVLDFMIIAGDTFNFKVYLNSGASMWFGKFLHAVLTKTQDKGTMIVFIEGTNSHDAKQMLSVANFVNHPRLKVVTEVTEDTLCGDISVLYVPEEYIVDQQDYYKEYFKPGKFYDIIIGHGLVDKMWFSSLTKHQEDTKVTKVPVFKVEDLLNRCSMCYFGHIHTRKLFGDNDRFKYISSFTRWTFGEEEDKGYILVTVNTESKRVSDEFIINDMAPVMITCLIDIRGEYSVSTVQDMIDKELYSCKDSDATRLIVNINKSMDNYLAIKEFIMNVYGNIPRLKLIVSSDISDEDMIHMKESMEERRNINEYVFDKGIPLEEKISTFIRNKMDKDITADQVKYYLNEKL